MLNETVLNQQQRIERARRMVRLRARLVRARELARNRLAPDTRIRKRALAAAREKIRQRFAGELGATYADLSAGDKMAVDRIIQDKGKMIRSMAKRLMPRIKRDEIERLAKVKLRSVAEETEGEKFARVAMATAAVASILGIRAAESEKFAKRNADLRQRMMDVTARLSSVAASDPRAVQRVVRDDGIRP